MSDRHLWAAGASLAVLAVASGAHAQDPLRELRAANIETEIARQDMLAAQREMTARQDQADTAVRLRQLDQMRAPPVLGAPLDPVAIPAAPSSTDSFAAQMDRLERLTQDAMARSNARVRAVRPASER